MSLKRIQEELSKIGRITARWNDAPVSDIERELVLDKLKDLYEEVMFFEREIPDVSQESESVADGSVAPSAEELGEQAEEMLRDFDRELGRESAEETISETEIAELPQEPTAPEESPKQAEPVEQPVVEPGPDQPLFDMDEIVVRRRIDHQTILSLYGENCEIVKNESGQTEVRCEKFVEREQKIEEPAAEPESVPGPEEVNDTEEASDTGTEVELELVPESQKEFEEKEQPQTVHPVVGKPGAVLGEVIAHGETLGDALARNAAHDDVASRVAATRTGELRTSIGINDKFLLIRDLFGGDARAYEEAISALEQLTDLDEAMLYLHDHYTWNPDSEGVKLLVELLVRKLS